MDKLPEDSIPLVPEDGRPGLDELAKQVQIEGIPGAGTNVTIRSGDRTINIKAQEGTRIITGKNITIDGNGTTVDGRRVEDKHQEPTVQYDVRILQSIERQLGDDNLTEIDRRHLEAAKEAQIGAMPNQVHLAWLQAELKKDKKIFYTGQFDEVRRREEANEAKIKKEVDDRAEVERRANEKRLAEQKEREKEELKRNLIDSKSALERMEKEMFGDGRRQALNEKTIFFEKNSAERRRLLGALSPEQRKQFKPGFRLLEDARRAVKSGQRNGILPPWAVKAIALAEDFETVGDPVTDIRRSEAEEKQKSPVDGLPYEEQLARAQNIAKAYPDKVPGWAQEILQQERSKTAEVPKKQPAPPQPKSEPVPRKKEEGKKSLFGSWPFGRK